MLDPSDDSSFMTMSTVVFCFIGVVFVLVVGTILVRAIQGGRQWHANNQAPVLTRPTKVVTKRADVQRSSGSTTADGFHTSGTTTTTYFVTMEDVKTRDRHEFRVTPREYGQLAEGDLGVLTSQGTRYQGFVRD